MQPSCVLQVETAKGLTIRVINNVSKRMEAKPKFHDSFQKEGCPDAFPYRQKVLLPALTDTIPRPTSTVTCCMTAEYAAARLHTEMLCRDRTCPACAQLIMSCRALSLS